MPYYLNTIIPKKDVRGKYIDNSLSANYGLPHVSTIFGLKLSDHEGRLNLYTVRGVLKKRWGDSRNNKLSRSPHLVTLIGNTIASVF